MWSLANHDSLSCVYSLVFSYALMYHRIGSQSSNRSGQHSRSSSTSSLSPSTLSQDSQPVLSQPSTGGGSVGAVAEYQGATPVSSGGSADAQQSECTIKRCNHEVGNFECYM